MADLQNNLYSTSYSTSAPHTTTLGQRNGRNDGPHHKKRAAHMTNHRHLWRTARTLEDLGELTARWLEGSVTYLPAYYSTGPAEETGPLVPTLATLNRAGYFTTDSQPGDPLTGGYGQRAFVTGFCDEALLARIETLILGTDLIAVTTPPGCDNPTQITVTIDGDSPFTWTGSSLDEDNIRHYYSADCPDAVHTLLNAWQVAVLDPVWGREDLLWGRLDRLGRS